VLAVRETPAGQQDWEIGVGVGIRVPHVAAKQDHGLIQ
jgi:hypothetical protein